MDVRNIEERNKLILENQGLIGACIRRCFASLLKKRDRYEDLYSAGTEALIRAAGNWDESQGTAFSTYATRSIYNAIKRFVISDKLIPIPEYQNAEMQKLTAFLNEYPDSSITDTAEYLGWSLNATEKAMTAYKISHVGSINDIVSENGDESEYENILLDTAIGVEDQYCISEAVKAIMQDIKTQFGETVFAVVSMYYGIGCRQRDAESISKALSISVEDVKLLKNRLRMNSLKKDDRIFLKLSLADNGIYCF